MTKTVLGLLIYILAFGGLIGTIGLIGSILIERFNTNDCVRSTKIS